MVTICVDGENKTLKLPGWTLWAGNDDRGYADLSFSQRRKIYSSAFCMSDNANSKLRNVFLERKRERCNIPG